MSYMFRTFIFYHVFLLPSITSFNIETFMNIQQKFYSNEETSPFMQNITESVSSILEKGLNSIYEHTKKHINAKCETKIKELFINQPNSKETEFYIYKLIQDSSMNKNDVSSYQKCMRKTYNFDINDTNLNFQYVLFQIDQTWETESCSTEISEQWYSLSFCLPKVDECDANDFYLLFFSTAKELKDIFELNDTTSIKVLQIDTKDPSSQFNGFDIFRMLPLFFIILQMIIVLFNVFPFCLFKLCVRSKYNNSRASVFIEDSSGKKYSKSLYKQIKLCFNKTDNSEELFNKNNFSSSINNYSGITYTKGLRGLNMILFLFGSVFYDLFNSYESHYNEESFINIMLGKTYSIYLIGMRYSPRILFSVSGFVLFYKYMCFIDDRVEEKLISKKEEEKKKPVTKKKSSNKPKTKTSKPKPKTQITKQNQSIPRTSVNLQERKIEDIPFTIFGRFLIYQLHRYFMLILLALFTRFSLYKLVILIKGTSPLWKQFYFSWIESLNFQTFIFALSTLRSFLIEEMFDFFTYHWMIFNEIFFFLFGSLLIFIGYRYQFRIDRFIIIFILILIIFKIFYYYVVCVGNEFYASLYYYLWDYGKVMITPWYNMSYFLIGLFFGSFNYVLQKGINYEEIDKQGKPFLNLPVQYVNYFQKATSGFIYFISIIGLCCIAFLTLLYNIIIQFFECSGEESCFNKLLQTHMINFNEGRALNFFYLIDMDIILFFVHWIGFGLYVKGNNFINEFLNYRIWASLDKCYFSYLLGIKLIAGYVFSQSDTRITFNLENIFLYSIIIGFWVFVFTIISYIFFELPYKRLIRLTYKKSNLENLDQEVANMSSSFSDQILISPDGNFDIEEDDEDISQGSEVIGKFNF